MISDTSKQAYKSLQPKLTKSQRQVYEVIRAHPEGLTNAEIMHYLGWPINRITGRTFELRTKHKMIYEHTVRICRVNHTMAKAYKIVAQLFPGTPIELPPAREKKEEKKPEVKKVERDPQMFL